MTADGRWYPPITVWPGRGEILSFPDYCPICGAQALRNLAAGRPLWIEARQYACGGAYEPHQAKPTDAAFTWMDRCGKEAGQ